MKNKTGITFKAVLKNIAALAFGCVAGLLLLEVVMRIYNPFEQRVRGNRIILPAHRKYVMTNKDIKGIPSKIIHTKNALGFRGPEKPADDFRNCLSIIAVGGSTTECLYLPDGGDWPAILGDSLKIHFKRFWINNAGLDGHSTFGHIILLKDYLVAIRPKVVLFLIGSNEIENTGNSGFESSHIKDKIRFSSIEAFFKSVSAYSEVGSLILNLYRYVRARARGLPHQIVDLKAIPRMPYPEVRLADLLKEHSVKYIPFFEKRLKALLRLSKENGILPVLITQPTLAGEGTDPVTQVNLAAIRMAGRSGYAEWKLLELYNDVTRRIGKDEGVLVVDLAREMPKNSSYYYDFLHYTEAGSKKVAEIIQPHLLQYLVKSFPTLAVGGESHPQNR